jgi:hypothetical protein
MKIMIKECNVEGEEVVRHGQLNLVDLAGSECVGRSGAKDGRAREAGSINQSLLTLGRVITALVDHHGHIPYRDSKLTRLLQESLGGKAKTCIIATLSPSQLAVEESMSTLDYAHRAKNIKNQPTVNQKSTKKVVLKEYCAEIESLKSQLQLTREKNGVYVDPAEFYAMETKLATQENQLTECEAALRSKSEEVKTLRSERDTISTELEEAQQTLTTTEAKLQVVTDCYEDTKVVLQSTEAELKATNAVVGEQVVTEATLQRQGASIQSELTTRREDVDGLLAKMDRYSKSETKRLDETAAMITKLQRSRTDLNQSTSLFVEGSEQQAEFLRNGVRDMLGKSRETCEKLRGAVDGALQTLIGDANVAKDSMTTSCAYLDKHLRTTETDISRTLTTIKEQLSSWLGDVDAAMNTAQAYVSKQQSQLEVLSASVAETSVSYVVQCDEFLKLQELQTKVIILDNREMRSSIISCIDNYERDHEALLHSTSDSVKSKALDMELAMKSMLQEFVESTTASLGSSVTQSKQHCDSLKTMTESGLGHAENKFIAAQSSLKTSSNTLKAHTLANAETFKDQIETIKCSRASAENTLTSISGTVIDKKRFLDGTVETLINDIGTAISSASDVVSHTSETANAILRDVTNATTRMNKATTESTDTLTAFLDDEGDAINLKLGAHFDSLHRHLGDQQVASDEMVNSVVAFGSEMADSQLKATGKTPKKTAPFKSLDKLASTRDHAVIKAEAVSGVVGTAEVRMTTVSLCELDAVACHTFNEDNMSTPDVLGSRMGSPVPDSLSSPSGSDDLTTCSSTDNCENGEPNQPKLNVNSVSGLQKRTGSRTGKKVNDLESVGQIDNVAKRSTRQRIA